MCPAPLSRRIRRAGPSRKRPHLLPPTTSPLFKHEERGHRERPRRCLQTIRPQGLVSAAMGEGTWGSQCQRNAIRTAEHVWRARRGEAAAFSAAVARMASAILRARHTLPASATEIDDATNAGQLSVVASRRDHRPRHPAFASGGCGASAERRAPQHGFTSRSGDRADHGATRRSPLEIGDEEIDEVLPEGPVAFSVAATVEAMAR